MKLYNTLSRQVEEITSQQPPVVTVYTCGPTVYDYPHIGNWFTYIREDSLIRALKLSSLTPRWVMNITDVGHLTSDADDGQDKLEKGAEREGVTAWDIAKRYTDYFMGGLDRLNIVRPDYLPKATDHIADQIALIQTLEAKGYTYKTSDGIYYDTAKFEHYADFARLDLDEQQAGARVETNPEKHQPTDFALWKFSPADRQRDMEWDSPWGKGFPGWHIECSAMSMKYLGPTLDIHAGGIDHIPIHHTNEIAQSEAATGQQFVHYWMHSNHITVEGKKISKSLGNGITLEDIEQRGISLAAFRLHVLESHYRSQSKFSWASLQAAQARLLRWQSVADLQWQPNAAAAAWAITDDPLTSLFNDLDTPQVLAAIDGQFDQITNNLVAPADIDKFRSYLQRLDDALGLSLLGHSDISGIQKELIAERETARQSQDWAVADNLRKQLNDDGLDVRDTPTGPVWSRLR